MLRKMWRMVAGSSKRRDPSRQSRNTQVTWRGSFYAGYMGEGSCLPHHQRREMGSGTEAAMLASRHSRHSQGALRPPLAGCFRYPAPCTLHHVSWAMRPTPCRRRETESPTIPPSHLQLRPGTVHKLQPPTSLATEHRAEPLTVIWPLITIGPVISLL